MVYIGTEKMRGSTSQLDIKDLRSNKSVNSYSTVNIPAMGKFTHYPSDKSYPIRCRNTWSAVKDQSIALALNTEKTQKFFNINAFEKSVPRFERKKHLASTCILVKKVSCKTYSGNVKQRETARLGLKLAMNTKNIQTFLKVKVGAKMQFRVERIKFFANTCTIVDKVSWTECNGNVKPRATARRGLKFPSDSFSVKNRSFNWIRYMISSTVILISRHIYTIYIHFRTLFTMSDQGAPMDWTNVWYTEGDGTDPAGTAGMNKNALFNTCGVILCLLLMVCLFVP